MVYRSQAAAPALARVVHEGCGVVELFDAQGMASASAEFSADEQNTVHERLGFFKALLFQSGSIGISEQCEWPFWVVSFEKPNLSCTVYCSVLVRLANCA